MKLLYIDTSSSYLYSAILEDTKVLAEVKKEFGTSLSEEALPEIAKLFDTANLKPKEINKIIVVNGPGSFTGIRIGVTIAKTYAWALKLDIISISALEAMSISCNKKTNHIPIIDARRGYVFAGIYDENSNIIFSPKHILVEDLDKELEKLDNYTIISNDELDNYKNIEKYNPDISKIVERVMDREPINPHAVNPEYLKLTEAEESKLNDNRV